MEDDELLESFDPFDDDELLESFFDFFFPFFDFDDDESFDPLDDDELLESDDSAGGYCGARVGYGGG